VPRLSDQITSVLVPPPGASYVPVLARRAIVAIAAGDAR
jgi:hypothetical protein